ncbi:MAG: class I SAM-dependent methyltransferase [Bacillota bacterium]|nr:class I SAM-dependent methyltransferase [Bacillota bacterium]NLD12087.1 class I SAM-dependent methyltransferase [Bacillota bacterium]HAV21288.1 16S rRNA methyltransferase [Bacillota bacterium]HOB88486.1 class I SAM-dependent methyltransferase [Bacillota bacterium]HOJ57160.1 class I SAM-dependent methyltransferase [Bacillota bacterium]
MAEHYFTEKPGSQRAIKEISVEIRGIPFIFRTDRGVFSRGKLDRGTRLLIDAMDLDGANQILDLGCGYGPIGIVAAKLAPESEVIMVDVNERACELARENAVLNRVANTKVLCGDGFRPVRGMRFDLVLCNPPIRAGKSVVFSLIAEAREFLKPGGSLLVVARTKQGSKSILKHMSEVFDVALEIEKGGGYRVMKGANTGGGLD